MARWRKQRHWGSLSRALRPPRPGGSLAGARANGHLPGTDDHQPMVCKKRTSGGHLVNCSPHGAFSRLGGMERFSDVGEPPHPVGFALWFAP
jgi:hypothetical protein